jgi:Flp pilus assembly protein TadG
MRKINLKKNKRAQLFTALSIVLIGLMFISFEIFSYFHERQTIKTRVSSMDNFLFSIEKNLERQMYISGFRILFLAENDIASSGRYVDVDVFFNEAFFNGTVNGVSNDTFLSGSTYNDFINSINNKSVKINVEIILTNSTINVTQVDPWNVKFTLTSDFVMSDKQGLARWDKRQVISTLIPIIGFEDPLYVVNCYSRLSRKINKTVYDGNYANGFDVSNLLNHVNNKYYSTSSDAPSFLDRMEGKLSANPNGIESFVIIPELQSQGIPTTVKSTVDHVYFSGEDILHYGVDGMPSWFRIDDNHYIKYNLTEPGLLHV